MSRRRQARELVLGCLYAHYSTGEPVDSIFNDQSKRQTYDEGTVEYARRIFDEAIAAAHPIDKLIRDRAAHWDFSRIGTVEKNILRAAVAELRCCPETPPAVVIDEAVELAHDYAGEQSGRFINGILDAVYKNGEMTQAVDNTNGPKGDS